MGGFSRQSNTGFVTYRTQLPFLGGFGGSVFLRRGQLPQYPFHAVGCGTIALNQVDRDSNINRTRFSNLPVSFWRKLAVIVVRSILVIAEDDMPRLRKAFSYSSPEVLHASVHTSACCSQRLFFCAYPTSQDLGIHPCSLRHPIKVNVDLLCTGQKVQVIYGMTGIAA